MKHHVVHVLSALSLLLATIPLFSAEQTFSHGRVATYHGKDERPVYIALYARGELRVRMCRAAADFLFHMDPFLPLLNPFKPFHTTTQSTASLMTNYV